MFTLYLNQPTMNQSKPTTPSPPASRASPCPISTGLLASFTELPATVQKMMEQRGVMTPKELRTSVAFTRFLEKSFDPATLRAVTNPQGDLLAGLNVVQSHLRSRSAEALAIHLYTKELLRLISVAAARKHLAAARNG